MITVVEPSRMLRLPRPISSVFTGQSDTIENETTLSALAKFRPGDQGER